MTADELTEKLIELRRKHREAIAAAIEKDRRAAAAVEEAKGLGVISLSISGDFRMPDWKGHAMREMWSEVHELVRDFMGLK